MADSDWLQRLVRVGQAVQLAMGRVVEAGRGVFGVVVVVAGAGRLGLSSCPGGHGRGPRLLRPGSPPEVMRGPRCSAAGDTPTRSKSGFSWRRGDRARLCRGEGVCPVQLRKPSLRWTA